MQLQFLFELHRYTQISSNRSYFNQKCINIQYALCSLFTNYERKSVYEGEILLEFCFNNGRLYLAFIYTFFSVLIQN